MRYSAPIHRLKRAAKLAARQQAIPLHAALDSIARQEGFASWSLLAARHAPDATDPASLLATLDPGERLLIAARPRQGKTLLALQLAVAGARAGRQVHFFSMDYTPTDVREKLQALGADTDDLSGRLHIDCSDDICADHVIAALETAPRKSIAVIDYLQLLDQRRSTPPVQQQVESLSRLARARGLVIAFICQIDRSFDSAASPLPGLADIRLPNPLDLSLFSRAWFLHAGALREVELPAG